MARRGRRQIFFVCIGMDHSKNEFVAKDVSAVSPEEAASLFLEKSGGIKAKEIHGPFYKKRAQVIENTRVLKFSDQTRRAEYNDWIVNAMILKEPENQAYLVFIKRADDKKQPLPKGTVVVPVSELRFI